MFSHEISSRPRPFMIYCIFNRGRIWYSKILNRFFYWVIDLAKLCSISHFYVPSPVQRKIAENCFQLFILDETIYANSKTWSPVANKGKSKDKSNDDFFPIVRWLEKYYSMGMLNFWMLIRFWMLVRFWIFKCSSSSGSSITSIWQTSNRKKVYKYALAVFDHGSKFKTAEPLQL